MTIIEAISDDEYRKRFNISKRWWLEDNQALMRVLCDKRVAHNQYVKPV